MTIQYVLAAGLLAAGLGALAATPASAATGSAAACIAELNFDNQATDGNIDGDVYPQLLKACQSESPAAVTVAPSVNGRSAIELSRPLPSKLARELRPYEAS